MVGIVSFGRGLFPRLAPLAGRRPTRSAARLSAAGEGDSPRVQLLPLMPKQPLTPTLSP
jgi:hypothetical protein